VGKAKVIENNGKGRYLVQLDLGSARRQTKMDALAFDIDELLAARADLFAAVAGARIDLDAARDAYEEAVALYVEAARASESQGELDEAAKLLEEPTRALTVAGDALREAEAALQDNETETANLERKYSRLESTPGSRLVDAWCADYTTYLAPEDDVATLEVPNEPQSVLVAPGGTTAQDAGNLMRTHYMSPAQAFYNAAILPGWQKTQPTYRFGTITGINADLTCNITLEAAVSQAQGISVNRAETLDSVPVDYMSCDVAGFKAGDSVLVKFRDQLWTDPQVIGFKSHPRPCPGGAMCKVIGLSPDRRAYPIEHSDGVGWTVSTQSDFNFGDKGWAGPWGGVTWDSSGQDRYVYFRNVDYWIQDLFPDLYFSRDGGNDSCLPVILGASVYRDTIIVVVETQTTFLNASGEVVVAPADYNRLDILALKPRAIDAEMEETERYVITSIPRETVFYDSTSEMEILNPNDLLAFSPPPPETKSASLTTAVGVASCVGFSISPDGLEYAYCNHTGAHHITLSEQSSGEFSASWEVYPSNLTAWERVEYDATIESPSSGRKTYEKRSYSAGISGSAIVGAKWTESGPEWVVYTATGSQVASTQHEREFETIGFLRVVTRSEQSSKDEVTFDIKTTGALEMQIASASRSLDRRYEIINEYSAGGFLLSSVRNELDYSYADTAYLEELENRPRFDDHEVEIPPESGVYVADRYQAIGTGATETRVVVANGAVIAAGAATASDPFYPPRGADQSELIGTADGPARHGWFGDGFGHHNFFDAPVEDFGFFWRNSGNLVQYENDSYTGFWQREIEPFHMCKFNRYWHKRIFAAPYTAYKSAVIGNAVFLSTTIDGQPFTYMTDADAAEVFGTESPAFDYIVAG
jgi:hypothetical protein